MRCVNKMVRFVVKRTMRAIPSIGDSVFLREKEARRVKPIYGGRTMKKYTQADFDNFKVDKYGHKICPAGDYTAIKGFGARCIFGTLCIFGALCIFGERCIFDALCIFGERCRFDERCSFCERCIFSEQCIFDEGCRFGEQCSYENGAVKNGRYVAVDRIGSENRKAYFYIDDNGNMFVRAGCWFSDMAAFKERVRKVHAGTIHEKTYLAACDLAELMLKGGNEE